MGVDQSKPGTVPGTSTAPSPSSANLSVGRNTKSTLQEEEIPYTSFSADKGKRSGNAAGQGAGTAQPEQGIVVVNANPFALYADVEPELLALQKIPYFTPLLKSSSGFSLGDFFSGTKDPSLLDVLKPDAVLAMCQIYQQHMKKIASGIVHDQKLLTTNVKQLESFCTKVAQTMASKHAQAQYYSDHLKSVPQTLQLLQKTNALASKAIKSLEVLNSMLPVEERLEPISVHIPYRGEYQTSLPLPQEDPPVHELAFKGRSPQKKDPPFLPPAAERAEPSGVAEAPVPKAENTEESPRQSDGTREQAEVTGESDGSMRERSKSTGGSTEYSSESSEPRKFRADLADENDREALEEEALVVHTSKAGKKKKKKKPAEIN